MADQWINDARNTHVIDWAVARGTDAASIDVLQSALNDHDVLFLRGSVGNDLRSFLAGDWETLAMDETLIAITARLEMQLWVASCWFEESQTFLNLDWSWITFDLGLAEMTEEFFTEGIRGMFGGSQR